MIHLARPAASLLAIASPHFPPDTEPHLWTCSFIRRVMKKILFLALAISLLLAMGSMLVANSQSATGSEVTVSPSTTAAIASIIHAGYMSPILQIGRVV